MTTDKQAQEGQTIQHEQIRDVMRHWATGVAIVSSAHEGVQHGMTVSSFTSLALDPPLVLVSLEQNSRTHDLVMGAGAFGVSILAADQADVSNRFAGRETEDSDRFEGLETHSLTTGCPLLTNSLAVFDCKFSGSHPAGTHTMMIGEVVAARVIRDADQTEPLLYFNRDYRKLAK
ncbi:MAG: flavin reductase [Chloroflexi bacterium]|nr:MAG: flavin reductase [Chloroflexota bacterium]MBL1195329.1 flavin reductase [Chloroflexota bacterium]NOH12613.1 flavin reductase [Chloroflexota bacterium]